MYWLVLFHPETIRSFSITSSWLGDPLGKVEHLRALMRAWRNTVKHVERKELSLFFTSSKWLLLKSICSLSGLIKHYWIRGYLRTVDMVSFRWEHQSKLVDGVFFIFFWMIRKLLVLNVTLQNSDWFVRHWFSRRRRTKQSRMSMCLTGNSTPCSHHFSKEKIHNDGDTSGDLVYSARNKQRKPKSPCLGSVSMLFGIHSNYYLYKIKWKCTRARWNTHTHIFKQTNRQPPSERKWAESCLVEHRQIITQHK